MRYRSLIAGIALAAAPLIAFAGPSTANAATAGGNPLAHANYTPGPAPFDNAGPLTNDCRSGQDPEGWYETSYSAVAQWNSTGGYWWDPTSGHTEVCRTNEKTINGLAYYEYEAVLNGTETNDCISNKNQQLGGSLVLNGCQAGDNYLLFSPQLNGMGEYYIITDNLDSCVYAGNTFSAIGMVGTSTGGNICGQSTGWRWETSAG